MKILYICYEYPPCKHGGIGSYTKTIAEQMALLGHGVVVVGVYDVNSNTEEVINGVRVIRLKMPKLFKKGRLVLLNVIKLWAERLWFGKIINKYVKSYQIDIVESHDFTAPIISKVKGAKLVVRLHGSNSANSRYINKKVSRAIYPIEKRGLEISNYIISVSNHITKITKETFGEYYKIKTIYNGVDLSVFCDQNIERDKNRIILVGRMHPVKGLDLLFNALNIVFEKNSGLYLDVICSVNERIKEELLAILDKKYHYRVHFIGRVDNAKLPTYLSSANFSILPSRAEAFPITPLESMACGTPVLMNDKFSAREIVDDGFDGWIVDCYDKHAFAEKILSISDMQTEVIDKIRVNCINKIKDNFGIEKINNDNVLFYKKVMKNEI